MSRRVVITGAGAVTPSGIGVPAMWRAVADGRSAIRVLDGPEFAELPVRIGGQVRDFDASDLLEPGLARRLSAVLQWAVAAGDEAIDDANARGILGGRVGVIAATGSGPVDAMQRATRALDARGPRAVPLALAMHGAPDAAAALLSQRHGLTGAASGVSATCASGAVAIGEGMRRIRHGYADAVLVVGMEDCLGPVNLASNANLRALATGYEDDPSAASRPFDRGRTGFVMSQGAAAVLLESVDGARARGARAIAEVAGFGASSDAHHPTAPRPDGAGAAAAIRACLDDAGVTAERVQHVNAHGTGTPAGDAAELAALEAALGDRARAIPLSATKSSTGHLLGASGVVEAIIAALSIRDGILPPTLNLDDPEPGWDVVAGAARRADVAAVLSTSFGFGGHNGALLIARGEETHGPGTQAC
ncbi:beta-ketoacyl-[acyl-carrier-protein] synthase family protein [Microbacterium sp. KNMS]